MIDRTDRITEAIGVIPVRVAHLSMEKHKNECVTLHSFF